MEDQGNDASNTFKVVNKHISYNRGNYPKSIDIDTSRYSNRSSITVTDITWGDFISLPHDDPHKKRYIPNNIIQEKKLHICHPTVQNIETEINTTINNCVHEMTSKYFQTWIDSSHDNYCEASANSKVISCKLIVQHY